MSFAQDEELLREFLVEAGEILEQLGEQLVDLEQRPEDLDLLNTIFRAFHTIKGGAGFLEISPLVELCHHAEDVFGILRQGERKADALLMDVILRAYDALQEMFEQINSGNLGVNDADPELISALAALLDAPSAEIPAEVLNEVVSPPPGQSNDNGILADAGELTLFSQEFAPPAAADEEKEFIDEKKGTIGPFVVLADEDVAAAGEAPLAAAKDVAADVIADDEFEALLDQIHGAAAPGKTGAALPAAETKESKPAAKAGAKVKTAEEKKKPAGENGSRAKARTGGGSSAMAEPTVRVDTRRLDEIMNLVGELVLSRNRLLVLRGMYNDETLAGAVDHLDLVTANLQTAVMKTRMQPIRKVFGRFPRVVRDLARNLGKDVHLEMSGEETELDKNLVEALSDPLVHLVRNGLDHGIEAGDQRESLGKPRTGTLRLSASQEGDHIEIIIEDDGGGMDADRLRETAVKRGLMDAEAAARLSERECFHLIFEPGFSTCDEVSDISGRGVGMDVVRTRISDLNGTINIQSEKEVGTKITVCLPLTMAIMPTLMVGLADQVFALPLGSIVEIINRTESNYVDGQEVMLARKKSLPILQLREWVKGPGQCREDGKKEGQVVVINIGAKRVGLVVDELFGQEDVVIKPLGSLLQGLSGLAGATITGNGRVSLILDVPGLVDRYAVN